MKKRQVVITGAGACGLMAAIMAARNGAAVTVLEQNEKPGKKICATGNGRCNFSNLARPDDAYRGEHPEFVEDALREFSVQNTIEFFKEIVPSFCQDLEILSICPGFYFCNLFVCLYFHTQTGSLHTEANIRNLSKMHSESFLSRIPLSFSKR